MFLESEILVQVLLRLIDHGVTALPIHDAVLVAEAHEQQAARVMHACFEEATGFPGVVKVER